MLTIASPGFTVTVLPEVGGKIGQIRDERTGYDFLVPPRKPYRTIAAGESWLEGDTSGMDDCFPNVAAGPYPFAPWTGTALPDLGLWTHQTWDVAEVSHSYAILERRGVWLPYFARKIVRAAADRLLEVSYSLENTGPHPYRYMWSAHPLIAIRGDYELVLPHGDLTFRTFPSDNGRHKWPHFHSTDLAHEWIPRGRTLKIFVSGLDEGWCELRFESHVLRITFDTKVTPILGLWFNNFGFPTEPVQFRCIAVEPCTSPSDLLDELAPEAYPSIEPGGRAEWSICLHGSVTIAGPSDRSEETIHPAVASVDGDHTFRKE